jgi:hypothetical protein
MLLIGRFVIRGKPIADVSSYDKTTASVGSGTLLQGRLQLAPSLVFEVVLFQ